MKYNTQALLPQFKKLMPLSSYSWLEAQLAGVSDLISLDENVTAKFNGYKDAHEYYSAGITNGKHHLIKVPTLFISAKDDQIVTNKVQPKEEVTQNENLVLMETEKGGHCCHFTGLFIPKPWWGAITLDFFDSL